MSTKVSSHLGWKQNFSRQTSVLGHLTRREREKKSLSIQKFHMCCENAPRGLGRGEFMNWILHSISFLECRILFSTNMECVSLCTSQNTWP